MDVDRVSRMDADSFEDHLGGVFESSPWVARGAWPTRPWASVDELHAALVAVVDAAPDAQQLALLRAHPDLSARAVRAADLTAASAAEQAAAGLDELDAERGAQLTALNADYRARFGFPFIVCAREHTPASLLVWGGQRLAHEPAQEQRIALAEVAKIARLRLADLIPDSAPAP